MPTITRTAVVSYSQKQMFDLVNDVNHYPQFLPWCPKVEVTDIEPGEIEATVFFAKGPMSHSFTTRNRSIPYQKVDMKLVKGPFRFLEGTWHFEPLPNGSKVIFTLSFEWSSPLLSMMAGPFFSQMAETLVDAFTVRAESVYAEC